MSLPRQLQQAIKDPFKKGKQGDDPEKEINNESTDDPEKEAAYHGDGIKKESDYGLDLEQKEVINDREVIEYNNITREDAMHMGELTPEELDNEKKLRKKIDLLIMPLVMLVSCAFGNPCGWCN